MNSSLIGKLEKAGRYAEQPDRVTFKDFHVEFRGLRHSSHPDFVACSRSCVY